MRYINAKSKYLINVKNKKIKRTFDEIVTKNVNITDDQLKRCKEYAKNYVNNTKDYSNLVSDTVKDNKARKEIAMQTVFAQKVAECGVLNYFKYRGLKPEILDERRISVKTCIDKDIHKRLIVDKDEFESKYRARYYIGTHLNLEVEDKKHPVKKYLAKDIYNVSTVQIYGYVDSRYLDSLRYETIINEQGKKEFKFYNQRNAETAKKDKYGKLPQECKWYYLDRVQDIEKLVVNIKNNKR